MTSWLAELIRGRNNGGTRLAGKGEVEVSPGLGTPDTQAQSSKERPGLRISGAPEVAQSPE